MDNVLLNCKKPELVNYFSKSEERLNTASHLLPAIISLPFSITALTYIIQNNISIIDIFSIGYFFVSVFLLYLSSSIYHFLKPSLTKNIFRVIDHCMIFIMISGTYTPICLSLIKGKVGMAIWIVNISCAILGIVLNAISIKKYDKICQALYIIMGWSIVCATGYALKTVPLQAIALILLGGLFYTTGTFFYRMKSRQYMHFVWHLFVILGTIPHYVMICLFCCKL